MKAYGESQPNWAAKIKQNVRAQNRKLHTYVIFMLQLHILNGYLFLFSSRSNELTTKRPNKVEG